MSTAVILVLVFAAIVLYALRTKGDVRAEWSFLSLKFSLHAADRKVAQVTESAPNCASHLPPTAPVLHAPTVSNTSPPP